jgi:hypothetical protein
MSAYAGEDVMSSVENREGGSVPPSIQTVRLLPETPVIYADGVSDQSYGPGMSKFHLFRVDPAPSSGVNELRSVVQIVMPLDSFVQMWAFFEHRLKLMIKDDVISREKIEQIRAGLRSLPGWSDEPL